MEKIYNKDMQIIEAVPNISDGKHPDIIAQIVTAAADVPGARVLHVDSNADANRTVITLAGEPQAVAQSAFCLIRAATQRIDMRSQHGAHPRLGAVDVCPLVPIREISLEETAQYADELARRVANDLQIPVYLYEENARTPQRKNLAVIRRGEYESLPHKLATLPPDYGPQTWGEHVAKTGATVIGARKFLIAFNMSLDTQDVATACEIAARLRERGGGLKSVKAIGWYMPAYRCAQVSCNLTDFAQTGLAEVFETCKKLAAAHGLQITAGELIGLVPQAALIQAGKFYAPNEKNTAELINAAVENLLLSNLKPFVPGERILEQALGSTYL
ncbi:MAG: glutamate formimidoyltransferase [Elusimicrobiaceae bacterium]|nr:glutamate formimidoyltransferase [Elusimicrobiaceae bacterium]